MSQIGDKPSPKPMTAKLYQAISLRHRELIKVDQKFIDRN